MPRIAPKGGVEIGGVTFPEGTTVGINPWVFHRDKDIWGQDADEFKPERWLVEDAARLDKYFIPVSPLRALDSPGAVVEEYFQSMFTEIDDSSLALGTCLVLASILLAWKCQKSAPL